MMNTDVVVAGGGVIGCSVAYYLAKKGISVTLIDKPKRGRASSASAGGLWPLGESVGLGCGVIFHKTLIEKGLASNESYSLPQLPKVFLDFAMQSNAMFPALSADLRRIGGIDFEYQEANLLYLMYDEGDVSFAQTLVDNHPEGGSSLDWISPEELAKAEKYINRNVRGALRFNGENQVNPYALANAYREAARNLGAQIITHTEVTGVKVKEGKIEGVETSDGIILCKFMVNAAGAWAAQIGKMAGIDIPVYPVRGQIIATETLPYVLFSNISTSDCYLAQKNHGELIIGSTTEEVGFDPGVTASAIRSLSKGAIRALPFLENVRVKRVWSGFRPGTADELPILGPMDGLQGYINACGHFRTGVLTSPITGLMISEMINGDELSHPQNAFLLNPERYKKLERPEHLTA